MHFNKIKLHIHTPKNILQTFRPIKNLKSINKNTLSYKNFFTVDIINLNHR